MNKIAAGLIVAATAAAAAFGAAGVMAAQQAAPAAPAGPPPPMRFFVTSTVQSGDLGGLAGADATCQKLATAAGAGGRTWRAYLSTQAIGGQTAVNARDRIGAGPWHNAKGELIANNVAELHGDVERDRNRIHVSTALDEKGQPVKARGDEPNEHDILTGSDSLGRALSAAADATCRNWTLAKGGAAMVGHHDRFGRGNTSWNNAHLTGGCALEEFRPSGGAGKFYCFATN